MKFSPVSQSPAPWLSLPLELPFPNPYSENRTLSLSQLTLEWLPSSLGPDFEGFMQHKQTAVWFTNFSEKIDCSSFEKAQLLLMDVSYWKVLAHGNVGQTNADLLWVQNIVSGEDTF